MLLTAFSGGQGETGRLVQDVAYSFFQEGRERQAGWYRM
jgi:hypothetical protein